MGVVYGGPGVISGSSGSGSVHGVGSVGGAGILVYGRVVGRSCPGGVGGGGGGPGNLLPSSFEALI